MSMNFREPINDDAKEILKQLMDSKMLPTPVVEDEFRLLFNDSLSLDRHTMGDLARAAKQPVTIELNDIDEVKVMSDGTKYQVTPQGWKKLK